MAVNKPIQQVTLRLKEEIASVETRLIRFVQRNPDTGFIEPKYPIKIFMESITYVLDENDNKIDIYDQQSLGDINLSPDEIMSLWLTPVTIGGVENVLGNVIADKIDAIIANRLA